MSSILVSAVDDSTLAKPDLEVLVVSHTFESQCNAASGSPTAKVRRALEKDGLTLEVEDNGSGMPSDVLQNLEGTISRVGIGIVRNASTVAAAWGRLEIE